MRSRRLLARGDEAVDVAHHIAERVGPRLLVPAGQMRVARAPRRRAATDPSAASRSPCRDGRSRARSGAPAASAATPSSRRPRAARSFLWPAQTCPTEKLPFAPLSNRSSTDARSSTLMSTSSTPSSPPATANASREPLGFLRFGMTVVMSPSTCGDAQPADVLREIAPVRADVAERGRRAALVRLEPPGVIGVLQQPVLQVVADDETSACRCRRARSRCRACCTSGLPR